MRYRHSIVLHAQRARLFDADIHICPDIVVVKRDSIPHL
jgi:hypothetical protein